MVKVHWILPTRVSHFGLKTSKKLHHSPRCGETLGMTFYQRKTNINRDTIVEVCIWLTWPRCRFPLVKSEELIEDRRGEDGGGRPWQRWKVPWKHGWNLTNRYQKWASFLKEHDMFESIIFGICVKFHGCRFQIHMFDSMENGDPEGRCRCVFVGLRMSFFKRWKLML